MGINRILGKIGGYLHLDVEYFAKNAFYLFSVTGVTLLCGLASSVILTRLLTRETYGQYSFVFSIFPLLAILALPGMTTAIAQSAAIGNEQVLIEGTKSRFKWGLLAIVGSLSVGLYYYYSHGPIVLVRGFAVASLLLPIYFVSDGFYAFLNGKKQFRTTAIYQSLSIVFSTLIIIGVVYFVGNLLSMVIASLLSSISINCLFFVRTAGKGKLNKRGDKTAIPFGKRMTLIGVIGIIRDQFDKIIVGLYLGFSDLAIYAIALMISELVRELASISSTVMFAKLAVMEERAVYREVMRRMPWFILGFVVICGIGVLLSPFVIPLLYSQKYLASVPYTQILLASVVLTAPSTVFKKAVLPSHRKTGGLFKLNTSMSVLQIVLMLLTLPKFGLIGLVIAKISAQFIETLYAWKLSSRMG